MFGVAIQRRTTANSIRKLKCGSSSSIRAQRTTRKASRKWRNSLLVLDGIQSGLSPKASRRSPRSKTVLYLPVLWESMSHGRFRPLFRSKKLQFGSPVLACKRGRLCHFQVEWVSLSRRTENIPSRSASMSVTHLRTIR